MEQLQINFPVRINGVILTSKIHDELNWLQLGGSGDCVPEKINNDGYKVVIEQLNRIIVRIMRDMAEKVKSGDITEEAALLADLYFVHETITNLKAPDQYLTE